MMDATMVKLYESAYTYLPFLYLYLVSSAVAVIYHSDNPTFVRYRPYTVLVFLMVNTMVHRYYKTKTIIRSMVHKQAWKCCTFVVYGIMGNLTHEMVFHDHHFDIYHHNIGWSFLYLALILIMGYYFKNSTGLIITNLAFLFIPVKRIWQINLHMYTLLTSMSIYMLYSKCDNSMLMDASVTILPLIRYFPYLRVQDEMIIVGFIQLYIEYYQRYIPEMKAAKDIEKDLEMDMDLEESDQEYGAPDESVMK